MVTHGDRIPTHCTQSPQANPHVNVLVGVKVATPADDYPLPAREETAKDGLEREHRVVLKIHLHEPLEKLRVDHIGVQNHDMAPFRFHKGELAPRAHGAPFRCNLHVREIAGPVLNNSPAVIG